MVQKGDLFLSYTYFKENLAIPKFIFNISESNLTLSNFELIAEKMNSFLLGINSKIFFQNCFFFNIERIENVENFFRFTKQNDTNFKELNFINVTFLYNIISNLDFVIKGTKLKIRMSDFTIIGNSNISFLFDSIQESEFICQDSLIIDKNILSIVRFFLFLFSFL